MNLLQSMDYRLYKLFLWKWRIKHILANQFRSFPELFIYQTKFQSPFAYVDRNNKLVFEVYKQNFTGDNGQYTRDKLRIFVFELSNATFSYNGDRLNCNSEMIRVYNDGAWDTNHPNEKGWWTKRIPLSIYSLVTKTHNVEKQAEGKTRDEETALLNRAEKFNPSEEKEITDKEMIL